MLEAVIFTVVTSIWALAGIALLVEGYQSMKLHSSLTLGITERLLVIVGWLTVPLWGPPLLVGMLVLILMLELLSF